MDKLRIFNIALAVFNAPLLQKKELEDAEADPEVMAEHPEIQVLELHLDTALRRVMRERDWTFLEQPLKLGEDEGEGFGYRHSYPLPEGLFRLTRADGIYRVVGGKLLTNGMPLAFGIMQTLPDSGIPEDFFDLVGFALAQLASPKLSPGDTKYQIAEADYRMLRDQMIANDVTCQLRDDREVNNGHGYYV